MLFLFDVGSCDTKGKGGEATIAAKPLFLRDRANVLFWKVANLDMVL